jgi:hypothetical protein
MNHSSIALFVAACVSGLGLSAESARANVTYLYTGNDFTTASSPFTTNDKVMISLTFVSALSPNLTVGGVNNVSPLAFTASDGVDTFTDSTALGTVLFSFGTDNVGAITEWQVVLSVSPQSAAITTRNAFGLDNDFVQHTFNSNGAFNNRDQGTWTVAAGVPEPSTWAMLLLGLGGLGFAAHRRNGKPAHGIG